MANEEDFDHDAVAVLTEQPTESVDLDDPDRACCEKCGFATEATACPSCGWYPSLGIHVEIDEAFEAVTRAAEAAKSRAESAEADESRAPAPKENALVGALEAWRAVPAYGWLLAGTTVGTLAACIGVRLAVGAFPAWHALAGASLLAGGLIAAIAVHVTCFVLRMGDDAELGVADVLLKPFKVWSRIFNDLPDRVWLPNSMNASLTAALGAAVIVGGIPYERLLDWGIKARPQQNLVGAIVQHAAQAEGDGKSLEGAIGDFTGDAAVSGGGSFSGSASSNEPAEKPRTKLECVIIGYQLDDREDLAAVLLAGDDHGKLRYLGRVKPRLNDADAEELLEGFRKHASSRPFVKTNLSGYWVQPRFTCRVTYTDWPKGRRPKELEWDALLETLAMPW